MCVCVCVCHSVSQRVSVCMRRCGSDCELVKYLAEGAETRAVCGSVCWCVRLGQARRAAPVKYRVSVSVCVCHGECQCVCV